MSDTSNVLLTPNLAARFLAKNSNNRPLKRGVVDDYAAAMLAGDWTESESAICIGEDGNLYNGQHRCHAVIQSGVTIPITLQQNMSKEALFNMDAGKGRRPFENYEIATGAKNTKKGFEAANSIRVLVTGRNGSSSAGETQGYYARHATGIKWVEEIFKGQKIGPKQVAPVRGALALAYETAPSEMAVFVEQYRSGIGLQEGDPALVLSNSTVYLSTKRVTRREIAQKTLRACLAHVLGEKIYKLDVNEDPVWFFCAKFGYQVKYSGLWSGALMRSARNELARRGITVPNNGNGA